MDKDNKFKWNFPNIMAIISIPSAVGFIFGFSNGISMFESFMYWSRAITIICLIVSYWLLYFSFLKYKREQADREAKHAQEQADREAKHAQEQADREAKHAQEQADREAKHAQEQADREAKHAQELQNVELELYDLALIVERLKDGLDKHERPTEYKAYTNGNNTGNKAKLRYLYQKLVIRSEVEYNEFLEKADLRLYYLKNPIIFDKARLFEILRDRFNEKNKVIKDY